MQNHNGPATTLRAQKFPVAPQGAPHGATSSYGYAGPAARASPYRVRRLPIIALAVCSPAQALLVVWPQSLMGSARLRLHPAT